MSLHLEKRYGLWGCVDLENDVVVIPHLYNSLEIPATWRDVFFIAGKNGKYGLLNKFNAVVIPFVHDFIYHDNIQLEHRFIHVRNFGKHGLLSLENDFVIPCTYDMLITKWHDRFYSQGRKKVRYLDFVHQLFIVRANEKIGLLNRDFQVMLPLENDDLQPYDEHGVLWIAKRNDFYGLVNLENEEILSFEYKSITPYDLGGTLSLVMKGNQYGVVAIKSGKKIVPFDYEYIYRNQDLSKNTCVIAKKSGRYGVVNFDNEIRIPFEYDRIRQTSNPSLFIVTLESKETVMNDLGQVIMPEWYNLVNCNTSTFVLSSNGKHEIRNIHGGLIGEYQSVAFTGEGIYIVGKDQLYGCVNDDGDTIVPFEYDLLRSLDGGLHSDDGFLLAQRSSKRGVVSFRNRIVVELIYDQIKTVVLRDEKYFLVEKDNLFGLLAASGQTIIPVQFEWLHPIHGELGLLIAQDKTSRRGLIDVFGKYWLPIEYDDIHSVCVYEEGITGIWIYQKGKGYGLIDTQGTVLLPAIYSIIHYLKDARYRVCYENVYFRVSCHDGRLLDVDKQFIRISRNGKNGYHNYKGEEVIPVQYDFLSRPFEGIVHAVRDKKHGYINLCNQEVIPFDYDYIDHFSGEVARVKKNDKWGWINRSGQVVIRIQYDMATPFENGYAKVRLNAVSFEIDTDGCSVA